MNYWLMKSEPDVYSIEHLAKDKNTLWEGVRNYQARNYMMKEMKKGDLVLYYHSNAEPSGIAGIARVSGLSQPDPSQFDKKSEFYDKKATAEKPIWYCVQVEYVKKFKHVISLAALRELKPLADMVVLQKGSRLSVQPVSEKHFEVVRKLAEKIGG